MQQYAKQAINYAGYYVNAAKQWWQPSQKKPLSPVEQLRQFLQNSKVQIKTKHSQPKIIIERVCMMYSQLISAQNKKYQMFKPTIEKPLQHTDHPVYQTKQTKAQKQDDKENGDQQDVSIVGEMKIRSQKIKCNIIVSIVFHESIQNQIPYIYIRNPDTSKTQPNPMFIRHNLPQDVGKKCMKVYQPIMGGVTLSNQEKDILQNQWKQYKPINLLNFVKKIEKLLNQYFPFVKRFTPLQKFTTDDEEYKRVINLKNQFRQLLPKIQQLEILKQSINCQNQHLKRQNAKMKEQITKNQNSMKNPQALIKIFKIQQNQQLLQLLSMERAYVDCLRLAEKEQNCDKYESIIQLVKMLSTKLFQVRFKIKQSIQKINLGNYDSEIQKAD